MIKEKIQKVVAIVLTAALTSTMMPCTSAKSAVNTSEKVASSQPKSISGTSNELKSTYDDSAEQSTNSKTNEIDNLPKAQSGQREIYSGTCGDNVTWELDIDTGVLTISGTGAMKNYGSYVDAPWYKYSSSIKSVTIANGVTFIKDYRFHNSFRCSNLETINVDKNNSNYQSSDGMLLNKEGTELLYCPYGKISAIIPDSVTSIESNLFNNCSKLETINVDKNNSNYQSSDGMLLNKEGTKLLRCPCGKTSGTVIIPASVTSIGECAFLNCKSLTSIEIPDSVTSIEEWAFSHCDNLTSIEIPNSVTFIGRFAFYNCKKLTSITIPNNVTSIEDSVFFCNGFASITIPNSVTSIGYMAFSYCDNLTSIEIPNSVTFIEEWAFRGCSNLESVSFYGKKIRTGGEVFEGCGKLSKVKVPSNYEGDKFCGLPVEKSLDPAPDETPDNSSNGSKLSGGAIAGIVIGSLTAVAAIAVGTILWVRHHSNQPQINQNVDMQVSAQVQA